MWISSGFDVLLQSFVYASSRQACTGPLLLNSSNPKPETHPPGSTMKAHEVLLMFSGLGFRNLGLGVSIQDEYQGMRFTAYGVGFRFRVEHTL